MAEDLRSSEKEQWKKAMKEEWASIEENATWGKAALPPGKTAIPCKPVLKRMFDDKGNVCCFNAHLMTKGFSQESVWTTRKH